MDGQQELKTDPEFSVLDRIGMEAASEEADRAAAEQAILNPPPENPVDPAIAWAAIPQMFGGLICMALPDLGEAYSDANCMKWGGAMAVVAEKHGWEAGEAMAKWAPEIALVMATLPLAVPTFKAIKDARAKKEAEKPKPPQVQADQVADGSMQIDQKTGLPIGGNFVKPE